MTRRIFSIALVALYLAACATPFALQGKTIDGSYLTISKFVTQEVVRVSSEGVISIPSTTSGKTVLCIDYEVAPPNSSSWLSSATTYTAGQIIPSSGATTFTSAPPTDRRCATIAEWVKWAR